MFFKLKLQWSLKIEFFLKIKSVNSLLNYRFIIILGDMYIYPKCKIIINYTKIFTIRVHN